MVIAVSWICSSPREARLSCSGVELVVHHFEQLRRVLADAGHNAVDHRLPGLDPDELL